MTKSMKIRSGLKLLSEGVKAEAHPLQCYWYLETFFERRTQSFYENSLPLPFSSEKKLAPISAAHCVCFFHFEQKTNVQVIGQKTGF